ncbi:HAUS augmin-like complex subunit 1 isoform X2 [Rhineura floridana]|uniref:HAUS augmin-like complex subunit 1 isoform X2 n=1 Tax=Rhineura floridana TaxID=261503 RepID=UPI002AC86A65|nr:HAUS augmin-like complex subunit 1 isoform X2 [Rhineura floridana]
MQKEFAGMEEKLEKVALWLKKTFGDQPIPPYEADTRTVDILYELAECNESRDGDVCLLIDDMKQKAVEYDSNGTYLQDLLTESLNLSFSSMSKGSTRYLNTLVDAALALETKDTSLASDLKKTEELLVMEKAKADSRTQNMKFLKDKSEDFKFRIKAAEEQLSASGMDASLTHESLVNLSEKLAELKKQAAPLKKKLESYLDLTPSPSLARVKIEEAKRELEAFEAEFSAKVDMTALSVPLSTKHQFS